MSDQLAHLWDSWFGPLIIEFADICFIPIKSCGLFMFLRNTWFLMDNRSNLIDKSLMKFRRQHVHWKQNKISSTLNRMLRSIFLWANCIFLRKKDISIVHIICRIDFYILINNREVLELRTFMQPPHLPNLMCFTHVNETFFNVVYSDN